MSDSPVSGFAHVVSTPLGGGLSALIGADDLVPGPCFVYMWLYPDGRPLYIGKGTWRVNSRLQRWDDHYTATHNKTLTGLLRKHGRELTIVIVGNKLSSEEALNLEAKLIKAIGRRDLDTGPLVNHTDGGDGGTSPSPEVRRLMSEARLGKPKSEDHRRKIGDSHRGLKKDPTNNRLAQQALADEHRTRARAQHENMSSEEKTARSLLISERTKQGMLESGAADKIRASKADRPLSEAERAHLANLKAASLAACQDPVIRARMLAPLVTSTRFKGRIHSEETKLKMRAAHRRRLELKKAGGNV